MFHRIGEIRSFLVMNESSFFLTEWSMGTMKNYDYLCSRKVQGACVGHGTKEHIAPNQHIN